MQPQEYRRAKQEFFKWTAKWSVDESMDEVGIPDVPEIITLLQAIGFKVLFSDSTNPMETSLTSIDANSKPTDGVKINVLCTKSGLRASLQAPSDCRCPEEQQNTSFWEVTGNAPNSSHVIKESGCDATYPISKGVQYVIKQVLNHLFNMIVLSPKDQNQNERNTPSRPSLSFTMPSNHSFTSNTSMSNAAKNANTSIQNMSLSDNIKIEDTPQFSTPMLSVENVMSPTRCRSLDTLTAGDPDIPKPGELKKDDSIQRDSLGIVHSSPNMSNSSKPSSTSSPNTTGYFERNVYRKVQAAQEILQDVLTMMQTDRTGISIDDISKLKMSTESLQSIKEKSIKKRPSLLSKLRSSSKLKTTTSSPNIKKTVDSPKRPSSRPLCRPSIRSTGSVSSVSSLTSNKNADSVKKEPSTFNKRRSLNEKIDKALQDLPPMRKKNLFANVKSTIPKPEYKKK